MGGHDAMAVSFGSSLSGMIRLNRKFMRYMPLIFMLFLYNFSAGLTL